MKMPSHIPRELFAPCGMNCMVCHKHLDRRDPCPGCLAASEEKLPAHCAACEIRRCTKEKNILYCCQCGEYPCEKSNRLEEKYLYTHLTSLIHNSTRVRWKGVAGFLDDEQVRWTCPSCAGVISLHDKTCSECGRGVTFMT